MPPPFLDTNVLLRHVLDDDPVQSPAAKALIARIEQGEGEVWTTDLAIAEVVWVLSGRRYGFTRDAIRDVLLPLIGLPGIKLANKRVYSRAFALYTSLPIDYVDAYHAALMEARSKHELLSYDADFDKVPGLIRREP
ncbi:MAG TPA: PIN domain-containing protein [Dehalococcoidia bacterium]|nr:PIN domain-containing protein [Dehalococcoidia bacterium]